MGQIDLKPTGYDENTSKKYWLHSAALFKNVVYDGPSSKFKADSCLGATTGGTKIEISIEYRSPEVDGVLTPIKGNDVIDAVSAIAETTIKEVTADTLALALNATVRSAETAEAPTGYKILELKETVSDTDYIANLGIYGRITGSNEPLLIIFENALSTGGLSVETKDKSEAGIPIKLEARADVEDANQIKLPVKIFFPNIPIS